MPKYIDVKNVRLTAVGKVDEDGDIYVSVRDVKRALEQTPAADVVEVVRCKDCIHYQNGSCNHFGYYTYAPDVDEDDFCSHGKRKETK
jgi:hypothetical protein